MYNLRSHGQDGATERSSPREFPDRYDDDDSLPFTPPASDGGAGEGLAVGDRPMANVHHHSTVGRHLPPVAGDRPTPGQREAAAGDRPTTGQQEAAAVDRLIEKMTVLSVMQEPWSFLTVFNNVHQQALELAWVSDQMQDYLMSIRDITKVFEEKLVTTLRESTDPSAVSPHRFRDIPWLSLETSAKMMSIVNASRPHDAGQMAAPPARFRFTVPPWDGNPVTYPEFNLQFNKGIQEMKYTEEQSANFLRTLLPANIKSQLSVTLTLAEMFHQLDSQMTESGSVSRATRRKLLDMKKNTHRELVAFYSCIHTHYTHCSKLGLQSCLSDAGVPEELAKSLPNEERIPLAERLMSATRETKIATLVDFCRERERIHRYLQSDDVSPGNPSGNNNNQRSNRGNNSNNSRHNNHNTNRKNNSNSAPVYTATAVPATDTDKLVQSNNSNKPSNFKCKIKGCSNVHEFHRLDECKGYLNREPLLRASLLIDWSRCLVCCKRAHPGGEKECFQVINKNPDFFCKDCAGYHTKTVCPKNFPEGKKLSGFTVFCGQASAQSPVVDTLFSMETLSLPNQQSAVVFYDSGASVSFVRLAFCKKNNLKPVGSVFFSIESINNQLDAAQERNVYQIPLGNSETIKAVGVPEITNLRGFISSADAIERFKNDPHSVPLQNLSVDLLIGSDHSKMLPRFQEELSVGNYILSKSVLTGKPIIQGGSSLSCKPFVGFQKVQTFHVKSIRTDSDQMFFKAESLGTEAIQACRNCMRCPECAFTALFMSRKEHSELKMIEANLTFNNSTKRWKALYPKNDLFSDIKDNYEDAYKRMISLEKKLCKNPALQSQFEVAFEDAKSRGLYQKLTPKEAAAWPHKKRYSPLVLVSKDSETTPLRICADSSSSRGDLSLNDVVVKGPPALNDLLSILLRFRVGDKAAVGDLSKFYNSIDSDPEDCHLRRVLWRDLETSRDPDIYITKYVAFGDVCAGVVTMTASRLSCEKYKATFPGATELIIKDSYVDDLLKSGKSLEDLKRIIKEADAILNAHGFFVKKWILSGDPADIKVLGVPWDAESDSLVLRPKFSILSKDKKVETEITLDSWQDLPRSCTKRQLYSLIMSLYDPLGFLSPLVVQLKLTMREVITNKCDWDECIPDSCWQQFQVTMRQILHLSEFRIPRGLSAGHVPPSDRPTADLVTFVDASSVAMCALVYLVILSSETRHPALILAKTKIAPQPQPTVPRMELLAAQMGARMADKVAKALTNVNLRRKYFLSDSQIVLMQLNKGTVHSDVFTTAKTYEILTKSNACDWYHIETNLNISDVGTRRDNTVAEDVMSPKFLGGPDFLRLAPDAWPVRSHAQLKVQVHAAMPAYEPNFFPLGKSLNASLRIVGWAAAAVVRFKHLINKNLDVQVPAWRKVGDDGSITTESAEAQDLGMKVASALSQKPIEAMVSKGRLKSVLPQVLDIPGLPGLALHVAGLRAGVNDRFNRSSPLPILPQDCELSKKIMDDAHRRGHGGVDSTNLTSKKHAWIVGGRRLAQAEVRKCHQCRIEKHQSVAQLMGPVPPHRVRPTPAFLHIQADLAGPYAVACSHHPRKTVKLWTLVCCCNSVSGAVFLTAIPGYAAENIYEGFAILANRYGPMRSICTDAGPNIKKAVELYNSRSKHEAVSHIEVAPRAQWRNGRAERTVGLFKRLLPAKAVDQRISEQEFRLMLSSIEDQINSRPLGVIKGSNSLDSATLITPNHVLRVGRSLDPGQQYDTGLNVNAMRAPLKKLLSETLHKIAAVTVPLAALQRKWRTEVKPLGVGSVVAFRAPNPLSKLPWCKGIVADTISSKDKKIRTYLIRTMGSNGEPIIRTLPDQALIPLEELD